MNIRELHCSSVVLHSKAVVMCVSCQSPLHDPKCIVYVPEDKLCDSEGSASIGLKQISSCLCCCYAFVKDKSENLPAEVCYICLGPAKQMCFFCDKGVCLRSTSERTGSPICKLCAQLQDKLSDLKFRKMFVTVAGRAVFGDTVWNAHRARSKVGLKAILRDEEAMRKRLFEKGARQSPRAACQKQADSSDISSWEISPETFKDVRGYVDTISDRISALHITDSDCEELQNALVNGKHCCHFENLKLLLQSATHTLLMEIGVICAASLMDPTSHMISCGIGQAIAYIQSLIVHCQ